MQPPTKLVLDTNVVLDWLVFEDPALDPLRRSLQTGRAIAVRNSASMAEFIRVLAYPQLQLDAAQQAGVSDKYQTHSTEIAPGGALPDGFPRCRDRDDELFFALAYHQRAVLVSRDKAVLALRTRAARYGMQVVDVPGLASVLGDSDADPTPGTARSNAS